MYRRGITIVHPSFEIVSGAKRVALKFMETVAEENLPINVLHKHLGNGISTLLDLQITNIT